MLFTMGLNLLATRLTLANLGVDDLGVYGVVGSVVSMFGVFSAGVTTAVQRFITFELGRGPEGQVGRVFSTSLSVLFLLSALLVVVLEAVGGEVLHSWVQIPEASLAQAQWVFQFTLLSFVFTLIAVPYNALVIAHERMGVFAAVSVIQVALTCVAAWSLSLFASGRLAIYGALMAAITILMRVIYQVYCHRHFAEARFRFSIDRQELREMGRFTGVATLSGVFQLVGGQGIILVINLTFGVALNAVYAIALQLKNMVLSFALNLFKAIQPQITKTYAEGAIADHLRLVTLGSRLEVFLIYLLMLPFLCRTEQVMALWLGQVPDYMVAFVRGTIFISLTYAAFEPIRTAVLATGRITQFMLLPEAFYLLVLPVAYLVARLTDSPSWMLVSVVGMDILTCMFRVWLGVKVSPLTLGSLMREVVLPCLGVGVLGGGVSFWLSGVFPMTLIGLFAYLLASSAALVIVIAAVQYRQVLPLMRQIWQKHSIG